jgi:L-alanine-DL-glutamate epimerase-like enolase superfamily enzyme
MVGCHVSTSLSMAPATVVAQMADYVDLDGPLLLERDREPSIEYKNGMIFPTTPTLWG